VGDVLERSCKRMRKYLARRGLLARDNALAARGGSASSRWSKAQRASRASCAASANRAERRRARRHPKPQTVVLLAADAEFAKNPILGGQENARRYGLRIVGEQLYSLSTEDFSPIVRKLETLAPDVLFICSYIDDSIRVTFGRHGEWAEPRVLQVQFQNVKGHGADQFKDPRTQVVVAPKSWASGELIYPYAKAR
jgi:hypothetical protein